MADFPAIPYLPQLTGSATEAALAVNAAMKQAENNPWLKFADAADKYLGRYARAKESDLEANAIADLLNGKSLAEIDPRLVGSEDFQKAHKTKDESDRGWKQLGLNEKMTNAQVAKINDDLTDAKLKRDALLQDDLLATLTESGLDAAALRVQELVNRARKTNNPYLMGSINKTLVSQPFTGKDLSIYASTGNPVDADGNPIKIPTTPEEYQAMYFDSVQKAEVAKAKLNAAYSDSLRFDNSNDTFESVRDAYTKDNKISGDDAYKFGEGLGEAARQVKSDLWRDKGINISLGHAAKLVLQSPSHHGWISKWITNGGNEYGFDTEPIINQYNDFEKDAKGIGRQFKIENGVKTFGNSFDTIRSGHGATVESFKKAAETYDAQGVAILQKQAEWEGRTRQAWAMMQTNPSKAIQMLKRIKAEQENFFGGRIRRDTALGRNL